MKGVGALHAQIRFTEFLKHANEVCNFHEEFDILGVLKHA